MIEQQVPKRRYYSNILHGDTDPKKHKHSYSRLWQRHISLRLISCDTLWSKLYLWDRRLLQRYWWRRRFSGIRQGIAGSVLLGYDGVFLGQLFWDTTGILGPLVLRYYAVSLGQQF